jgi:predicted Zn-dependent protease
VALDARLDQAWYGLALVLIQARRFEEAAEALQKNTALQPLSPYGWYRLAQVWLALGQPGKARKVIAHLRRFEPRVAAQLERENAAALCGRRRGRRCSPLRATAATGARTWW